MAGLLGIRQALIDENAFVDCVLDETVDTAQSVGDVRPVEHGLESSRGPNESVAVAVGAGVVPERWGEILTRGSRIARFVDSGASDDEADLHGRPVRDAFDLIDFSTVGRPHVAEQIDGGSGRV